MQVINVHQRILDCTSERAAPLIDGLASPADILWPGDRWPPMRLRGGLRTGASGGHGPIRYVVEQYEPGTLVRFRFTAPRGFLGHHWFELEQVDATTVRLRHTIRMRTTGAALLAWPVVFRPLHNALLEDALDRAGAFARSAAVVPRRWSGWVVFLRWILRRLSRQRDGIHSEVR